VAIPILLAAIAVSALAAIVSGEGRNRTLHYLAKPFATLLVIGLACLPSATPPPYQRLIVLGLMFSLAGDILLMLPRDRFVAGLAAFLIAHLHYIAAFARGGGATSSLFIILPLLLYAALLLRWLLPHVPAPLRVPVLLYALALAAMVWQAAERAHAGRPGAMLAAAGALLFLVSDSALASNRFVRHFRGADALVLGTYFTAQALIALSLH
jgi:uncharacterized membrane protein YhhN